MEILLAIVVAAAVIFFGALISMGNERQKKAIDKLHDDISRWAEQDLLMKREKLSLDVQVPDPLGWFSKLSSKVMGMNINLDHWEFFEDLNVLHFSVENSTEKILFSSLSPADIRHVKNKGARSQLRDVIVNPLLGLPRGVMAKRLSLSNGGFLFDLELPLAWKALTGREPESGKEFWLYFYTIKHA